MDKAARAVRRSSAKLLGGGHADLHLLLSEVKDMRNTAKSFMNAQNAVAQDLLKWAVHEENRALQDVANQLAELNLLWTEVQREFGEHIKDYRHMFEMVLEGEKHVMQSKNNFAACEQKEMKVRKELKKAFKKASGSEIQALEGRLSQAERAKDLAQLEVADRIRENEAVKLIRLKEGLMKISHAYSDFARKCVVVFDTQQDIVQQLPDVADHDLEDIKYTGSGVTRLKVQQAKEKVRNYRRHSAPIKSKFSEPPPPYSLRYNGSDDEDDDDDDHSSIYRPVTMSSPRRRVSSGLEYPHHSPTQLHTQTPAPATPAPPTAAAVSTPRGGASPPLSPPLPSRPPSSLPVSVAAVASGRSPPSLALASTSRQPTPPRPVSSPVQATAAAAATATAAATASPGGHARSAPNTPDTGSKLYPQLGPPTLTVFPDTGNLPQDIHHQSECPPRLLGNAEELHQKQYLVKSHQAPAPPPSFASPKTQASRLQGKEGEAERSLELVDFNPDWDNSYEEGLSLAMGGSKI